MDAHETIAIWSDYDMDGIPGAALLFDTFRVLGYARVIHHTPHRNRDGFGLNRTGLQELKDQGATLVITIDCGIGDVEHVAYANTLGLDAIVTDHHLPHETLPPAYAILNPKQNDCTYPEKMLCGAAVAFKLAHALIMHVRAHAAERYTVPPLHWERWLLDMAGMSTVADLVPLVGENRVLARFGLTVLRKSRRPGLQALLKKARVDQRHLTEDDIGFTIAPRVNAASRMGHARDAFALLTTTDHAEAGALADALDRINNERKTTVAVMKREIGRRLEKLGEPKGVIVLGNPDWKPSLLGLVAGGLAETYKRPVFLWGREEGTTIKGSCRSDGTSNVFEVMHAARHVFIEYGGHAYSGGFSIAEEHIHALEQALVEAHQALPKKTEQQERFIDAELTAADITWDTYRTLETLAPFGEGNSKPLFMIRDVTVERIRMFGKGKEHLELAVRSGDGDLLTAISFFSTPEKFHRPFGEGDRVSIVVHLEANQFRGTRELRLRLVDVV
jgi:single-stranded-DNA-specific exonuclease